MVIVVTKKQILKFLGIFLCIGMIFGIIAFSDFRNVIFTSLVKSDWGLSYQKEGCTPVGNADKNYLKQYNSFFVGEPQKKVIYLTFDAGFEAGYTPAILDALKKHNVKCTFFVVGNYLNTAPDLIKRMVDEGHIVANHTYSHPDMSKISDTESFKKEIQDVENKFKEITGKEMQKFYRPPQGKFNENNLKMANELGYKTIFWSLAYVDWLQDKQPTKEESFNKLLPRIHPGAIVLLHNTSKTNSQILDELLTKWEQMGYTFGTLDTLN